MGSITQQERLNRVKAEIEKRINDEVNSLDELSIESALNIISDYYQSTRIPGFPLNKRKDFLQFTWHFDENWIKENELKRHNDKVMISVWRLLVIMGQYAWVSGVSFYYPSSKNLIKYGNGIISCENPRKVDEFMKSVTSSGVMKKIRTEKPAETRFYTYIMGIKELYVPHPAYDIEVKFKCRNDETCKSIVDLFDIIAINGHKNYLGLTNGKSKEERSDIFWDLISDKIEFVAHHQYENVWGYNNSLQRINYTDKEASLHYLVDIKKNEFCQQIGSFLKQLGAIKVEKTETLYKD